MNWRSGSNSAKNSSCNNSTTSSVSSISNFPPLMRGGRAGVANNEQQPLQQQQQLRADQDSNWRNHGKETSSEDGKPQPSWAQKASKKAKNQSKDTLNVAYVESK
jgi:hypothetical protein